MTSHTSSPSPPPSLRGNQPNNDPDLHPLPNMANNLSLLTQVDSPTFISKHLPTRVTGSMVWAGTDFTSSLQYVAELTKDDVGALEKALKGFKELGLDGSDVSKDNFPLPASLKEKLTRCALEVHQGRGFIVLRGIDCASYSPEDNLIIYLGVTSYVGDERGMQDRRGNMLSHITDSKRWAAVAPHLRHGIHQKQSLPFHNDMGTEILALQTRQCAKEGGYTCISSAWKLYNELMQCHPDVVEALVASNWPIQVSGQKGRFIMRPLMQFHEGKIMICMDPGRLGPHPTASPGQIPALTTRQRSALATIHEIASKNQLRISSEPGDVLFINNFSMLHARERYVDSDSTERHLVRLWLRNSSLGWAIPESLKSPWMSAFGSRNPLLPEIYPVVPAPIYEPPKFSSGSAAFVIEDSEDDEDVMVTCPSFT